MAAEDARGGHRPLRDLSRYFSTELVNAVTTVAGVAIFTRLVEPAEYGQFALTIAAGGITMAVCGEWLQASVLRLVPGMEGSARVARVRASQFLAYSVAAGIVIVSAIGAALAPNQRLGGLILAGGLYAASSVAFLTSTVLFQATHRAGLFAGLRSGFSVLRVACAVGLVALLGRTPFALVMGYVASLVLLLPFAWYYLRGSRGSASQGEVADARSSFFAFGLPLIGWYAASQTLNLSDRFFLQAARGSFDVGLYSVTYSLAMGVMAGVVQPLLSTAHPLIVQAWNQGGEMAARRRLSDALRALALVGPLLVAGLGAFGPSLLRILAPARYGTRGTLSALLGAGILLWFTSLFLQKELELRLESARMRRNLMVAACVNVVTNFILISRFGMMGAAGATVVGYGVYTAMTLASGWGRIPGIPRRTLVSVVAGTTVFVVSAALLSSFTSLQAPVAQVLVVGPVALLGYVACVAITGELGDLRRELAARAGAV